MDIVDRLMDYDRCHDGDIDEAAREISRLRRRVKRLERFKEILRTMLDTNATMAEFKEAVKAVSG